MVHPIFGCLSDDCVLNFGLYTKCSELIPSSLQSGADTIEESSTYASKVSSKTTASTEKLPLKNTKYSAADPPSFTDYISKIYSSKIRNNVKSTFVTPKNLL
ncbi:unnamed protein product [Meloidogyne enterolobii]|uniref:Uncharacterized protein n=1 Tax=Meloidogyne enterolobii TaxID=390850 RepID=A0ACB0ZLJ4_MELEN